jgi:hypothetical protein
MRVALLVALGSLAFAASASAKLAYQRLGEAHTSEGIYVARDDGSHPRRVIGGYYPYLSPRGHRIAYFGKSRVGLHVVGVGGRHERLVLRRALDAGRGVGVAWSPDERYLVAPRPFERKERAYLVDLKRETARHIWTGYWFRGASFAPDGSRVVLSDAGAEELTVFRLSPFASRDVLPGTDPVWGRRGLAFARVRRTGGVSEYRDMGILVRRHGRNRTVLHEERAALRPVDWTADGRVLLVAESTNAAATRWQPLLLRPASGELRRVPVDLHEIAALSDDGRRVLGEDSRDVVSVTADGTVETLAREATHPSWTK